MVPLQPTLQPAIPPYTPLPPPPCPPPPPPNTPHADPPFSRTHAAPGHPVHHTCCPPPRLQAQLESLQAQRRFDGGDQAVGQLPASSYSYSQQSGPVLQPPPQQQPGSVQSHRTSTRIPPPLDMERLHAYNQPSPMVPVSRGVRARMRAL